MNCAWPCHASAPTESWYHSIQTQLDKRFSNALSAGLHYTWSRFEDTASEVFNPSSGEVAVAQDSFNIEGDRGRSTYDRPHRMTGNFVWELPWGSNRNGGGGGYLGGWQVSSFFTLQSGAPLTISSGLDRNLDGLTNDRADIVGDPALDSDRPREELIELWFNTAAFAQPVIGLDGTAGRSIVEGPGYRNVDLGVFRDIRLGGRTQLQFRLEATNVLNTVNLQNPGTALNAPNNFGKIRSARDMRRIQLGARVSF